MVLIDGEVIDRVIVGQEESIFRDNVGRDLLVHIGTQTSAQADIVNDIWDILYEGMRGETGHIEM